MAKIQHDPASPVAQNRTPVRCAVYIRVNVGAVQDTESIRLQRETAEAFIESRESDGWTCVGRYEDIGYSAGKLERPGFQRLLQDINDGKVDYIIVYTLDRLVRLHEDYLMLAGVLRRSGVKVISVFGEPYVVDFNLSHVGSNGRAVDHRRQTSHDGQSSSIPMQLDRILEWAANNGVKIIRDVADSGKPTSS